MLSSVIALCLAILSSTVSSNSVQVFLGHPYPPAAALFGPGHKFVCNAVIIGKGRVLTTADCLKLAQNSSYVFGRPQDFNVAMEMHNIEAFDNGKAFVEPARSKLLRMLIHKPSKKYDNKYANDIFSDRLEEKEVDYLMKGLRAAEFGPKWSNFYVNVTNYTAHPGFKKNFTNDLAIVKVSESHPYNEEAIAVDYMLNISTSYYEDVKVYGYGVISTGSSKENRTTHLKLRTVEMYILPPNRCLIIVGALFNPQQHICLMPRMNETLCYGFTGAPIVLGGKLIGVVEFGEAGCSLNSPVVGIQIGAFRNFLGLPSDSILDRFAAALQRTITRIAHMFA